MDGPDTIQQQTTLYGEPLSVRFGRLLHAYRIPQSRLASVIGLSAPMLSQLASGQRVKIGNPAVYARLLRLEELADSAAVRSGDPAQVHQALDDVAASNPALTTAHGTATRESVLGHLRAVASPGDLDAAARAVPSSGLAALLLEAAHRDPATRDGGR